MLTDDVVTQGPEKGAVVELLMEDMPFDVSEDESIQALKRSNWDHKSAKERLRMLYGHRQKIFF